MDASIGAYEVLMPIIASRGGMSAQAFGEFAYVFTTFSLDYLIVGGGGSSGGWATSGRIGGGGGGGDVITTSTLSLIHISEPTRPY